LGEPGNKADVNEGMHALYLMSTISVSESPASNSVASTKPVVFLSKWGGDAPSNLHPNQMKHFTNQEDILEYLKKCPQ
jgi:hypothetical protein